MEHRKPKKNIDGIRVSRKKISRHSVPSPAKPTTEPTLATKTVQKEFHHVKKTKNTKHFLGIKTKKIIPLFLFTIVVFILFTLFDRTSIEIIPRVEHQDIEKNIDAELYPRQHELGFDVISLKVTEELLVEPDTQESYSEFASGMIRVFNNYSTEPQRLIEETRFKAVGGKVFKIPKGTSVIIPGKNGDNPGFADVLVYASEPGPDYNIDLTDFSIPGFKEAGLTEKYTNIYGLSLSKMEGGEEGVKTVLSENQLTESEQILKDRVKDTIKRRIQSEKTHQFFLVENTARITLEDIVVVEEGNAVRLSQTGHGSHIIVSKEHLESFILDTLLPVSSDYNITITHYEDMLIRREGSQKDFSYLTQNRIPIFLRGRVYYQYDVDTDTLVQSLHSRKLSHIMPILINMNTISYAHINVFPFWRKKTSSDISSFSVDILEY